MHCSNIFYTNYTNFVDGVLYLHPFDNEYMYVIDTSERPFHHIRLTLIHNRPVYEYIQCCSTCCYIHTLLYTHTHRILAPISSACDFQFRPYSEAYIVRRISAHQHTGSTMSTRHKYDYPHMFPAELIHLQHTRTHIRMDTSNLVANKIAYKNKLCLIKFRKLCIIQFG